MDENKLYNLTPEMADLLLSLKVVHLALLFSWIFGYTNWLSIILFGTLMIGIVSRRFLRGPFRGPAVVEIGEGKLIFRDPVFIPTKIRTFHLSEVGTIKVVGPASQRRLRVIKKDGVPVEVSRQLGSKNTKAILAFLRPRLPASIPIVEVEPPGFLSAVRRDF